MVALREAPRLIRARARAEKEARERKGSETIWAQGRPTKNTIVGGWGARASPNQQMCMAIVEATRCLDARPEAVNPDGGVSAMLEAFGLGEKVVRARQREAKARAAKESEELRGATRAGAAERGRGRAL